MSKREVTELVGIAAVLASLLFLACEIRQSNQIARSTVTFELANNASGIHEIVWTNPDIAAMHGVWQHEVGRFPGLETFEFHARAMAAMERKSSAQD